jgi:hypothetical protein
MKQVVASVAALAALFAWACADSQTNPGYFLDGGPDGTGATSGASGQDGGAGTATGGSGGTFGTGGSSATGGTGAQPECTSVIDCYHLDVGCKKGFCSPALKCEQQTLSDGATCDDGNLCTVGESCSAGTCAGGTPKDCSSLDSDCATGACGAASGECITVPKNEGLDCDDSDACTSADKCAAGKCEGTMKDCTSLDARPCVKGECNKTTVECEAKPQTGPACEDGNPCTLSDTCQAGTCAAGSPKDCSKLTGACADGVCDTATGDCMSAPKNEGMVCNDNNGCTINDKCAAGACVGPAGNEGQTCEDQVSCTTGEVCVAGECFIAAPRVYFVEPFASNDAGWTLGTEWEIGAAKASSGGNKCCDPENDHTPSADDGVAGVVIGGNASGTVHDFFYLESPAFDTTGTGQVHLSYYRWLNCLWDAFMMHTVDVWDGTTWHNLFTNEFPGTEDTQWTFESFDVTQYRNAGMRVRFGFEMSSGVEVGSWNIDDVVVASTPCP